MFPAETEVKDAGGVHNGLEVNIVHIPSAGGAAATIAAVCCAALLVWVVIKRCKRHDRAAKIKNLVDLRRFTGGGGREDVEMAFEMGPKSHHAAARLLMFPAQCPPPGALPNPFGNPALRWDQHPAAIAYAPRPRMVHPPIQEIEDEEDSWRPATVSPFPERADERASDKRKRKSIARLPRSMILI